MIPKKAIDQASTTHFEDQARARIKLIGAMGAEWSTLDAGYKSAESSYKSKIKAINKDRGDRKQQSYKSYLRDSHQESGSSFATHNEEMRAIDGDCANQIELAREDRERTFQQHEERYTSRVREILGKYKDASDDNIDKFISMLPSSVE